MKNTTAAATAIGSLLTLGAAAFPTAAFAADPAEMEKCYGVVKAGKNDCAGPAHACAGQSKVDAGPKEFVTLPKGTCARLTGGSLTAK
ncbi:MAG: DUF2282 domain-containing protein [Pseudomonadota bacterium]|nr:DUF2282 domain-containing protein [Pseudomonadota bacterium]